MKQCIHTFNFRNTIHYLLIKLTVRCNYRCRHLNHHHCAISPFTLHENKYPTAFNSILTVHDFSRVNSEANCTTDEFFDEQKNLCCSVNSIKNILRFFVTLFSLTWPFRNRCGFHLTVQKATLVISESKYYSWFRSGLRRTPQLLPVYTFFILARQCFTSSGGVLTAG